MIFKKMCTLSLLIFIFSVLSVFADTEVPERIRVGIFYDAAAMEQVQIQADHGFSAGQYAGDQYTELVNLSAYRDLTVTKDNAYHLQINAAYGDKVAFDSAYDSLSQVHPELFAGFENGWRIYFGSYNSLNDAAEALSTLQNTYPDNELYLIEPSSNNMVLKSQSKCVFMSSMKDQLIIKDISYDGSDELVRLNGKPYRDGLMFAYNGSGLFNVINSISMQAYLYGVLPKEMSKDWPIEALKAQAIAARNYAMLSMHKHQNNGFDICPKVHCQVYGGYSYEGPISNLAVDETKGQLLYYGTELVQTFYHSSSGGQTENSENIWSTPIPYLKGVSDPFSANSPNSNWQVSMSKSTIKNALDAYGKSVGTVNSVDIIEKSVNGRVLKLKITGSQGSVVLTKEETRKVFGYSTVKSMWFSFSNTTGYRLMTSRGTLATEGSRLSVFNGQDASSLDVSDLSVYNGKSFGTLEKKEVVQTGNQITFYGHGYGHGLGMSQWGAKAMADQGYTYEQILTHYYKDTRVQ